MKIVVQVRLLPSPVQAAALAATLREVNALACWVSQVAFEQGVTGRQSLQRQLYQDLKSRGLSAQPALHVIRKVADAYTTLRGNIRAGNLGPEGSLRRVKAESKPIRFRSDAAQPFDDRCLSWQHDARTVSIWTMAGRLKDVAYTGSVDQLKTLVAHRRASRIWCTATACGF